VTPVAAAAPARHVTKQRFVYATLREAIIRGELKPGARLVIDDVARRFDISIIPVREALRLLESEGLVVNTAHVGAAVAPVSRQSVVEVFALLEGLETMSARAAAAAAPAAELAALEKLVVAMDRALDRRRQDAWAELNTEFHLAIGRLSGMPMVNQMLQRALDHWDRVRRHFFTGVFSRRAEQAQREHKRMVAQLEARDEDGIEQTMRAHNRGALAAYLKYLDSAGADASAAHRP
jgi:DNA-binding GntR family transcriptional regulator